MSFITRNNVFGDYINGIAPKYHVITVFLMLLSCVACAKGRSMPLPFRPVFSNKSSLKGWNVNLAKGNHVRVTKNGLQVDARQNTYANISRALNDDLVTVKGTLHAADGESWVTSLVLYWNARNWCQISVIKTPNHVVGGWYAGTGGGNYFVVEMINGHSHAHYLESTYWPRWHHLAIQLGVDCIRFQCAGDGKTWVTLYCAKRPSAWRGKAPTKLIIGKGYSDGSKYPKPYMANNYRTAGPRTIAYVKDLSVTRTPKSAYHLTALERKEAAHPGVDWRGRAILAKKGDPTFAEVSRYFPPMLFPREVVGIKDHPQDIGVRYDGAIELNNHHNGTPMSLSNRAGIWEVGSPAYRLGYAIGTCSQHLLRGYMPIVICDYQHAGLKFQQTVFGYSHHLTIKAPMYAYIQMTVANPSAAKRVCRLTFRLNPTKHAKKWLLTLPAGSSKSVYLKVPFNANVQNLKKISASEYTSRRASVIAYWKHLLNKHIDIRVPDQRFENVYRTMIADLFLNVDKHGNTYDIYDGSGFYQDLYGYSAGVQIRALDLIGYHRTAQHYLNTLVSLVHPNGLFKTHFGLPDTGELLLAIADHYRLTHDSAWLKHVAPVMIRMCRWISRHRAASKAKAPKVAAGLIYYRPYADYPHPTYCYFTDAALCVGMRATANVFQQVGMTAEAKKIGRQATNYRKDILRSMGQSVFEHDGMKTLPMMPTTHRLLKLSHFRENDYHGLVSMLLLGTNFLKPDGKRAKWVVDRLQQRGGVILGCLAWRGGIDHAYAYGYLLNELERNRVRHVILGLQGWLAYGMSRHTHSPVEVNNLRSGDNQPTLPDSYSCAQQLRLMRDMLVREDGQALILGQAVPRQWLKAKTPVEIRNAPTYFGKVSYSMEARRGGRQIKVTINPPSRNPPAQIRIVVRQPDARSIKSVTMNGHPIKTFNKDTITLKAPYQTSTLEVDY